MDVVPERPDYRSDGFFNFAHFRQIRGCRASRGVRANIDRDFGTPKANMILIINLGPKIRSRLLLLISESPHRSRFNPGELAMHSNEAAKEDRTRRAVLVRSQAGVCIAAQSN